MLKISLNTILLSTLLSSQIYATENSLNIDNLLTDIEKKSDLSDKTKLENSGISLVYTRDDLKHMQARYLKDVLKSSSEFGYGENRYGGPDPMNYGDFTPFISTSIRVFIDNQEISSGIYGSGMLVMGDLNIGFVDHIEVYTQTPTYEYSTEPTVMLVKLYSKSSAKDEGSKVEINADSYESKRLSGFVSHDLSNGWSYFAYASMNDLKREKYKSFDATLSKDKRTAHVFSTFSNRDNNILLEVNSIKRDAFIGPSYDATPVYSKLDTDLLHLGYDGKYENFSYLVSYDYMMLHHDYRDDIKDSDNILDYLLSTGGDVVDYMSFVRDVKTRSDIFSAEFKYKKRINDNDLIVGVKHRYKKYWYENYDESREFYMANGVMIGANPTAIPQRDSDVQAVSTLFVENQYSPRDNLILSLGLQGVNVKNVDAIYNENNSYFSYRYGLTYLQDNWVFKTLGGHFEVYLEPYLVDNTLNVAYKENQDVENILSDSIFESVSYKNEKREHEFILGYILERNYLKLMQGESGLLLDNHENNLHAILVTLRNKFKYRNYDQLFFELSVLDTIGTKEMTGEESNDIRLYKMVLRNFNTFSKFDFFNELIYERSSFNSKNFYDLNLGVKYNHSNSLSFSLKGENVLDRAVEQLFFRVNPLTKEDLGSLGITPYDQKLTLTMEYLF